MAQLSTAQLPTPAGYLGSQNKVYALLTVLQGHTGLITCLGATDDGKLASGGEYTGNAVKAHD